MFGRSDGSTASTSRALVNVSFQLASTCWCSSITMLYPFLRTYSLIFGIKSLPSLSVILVHQPKWFNPKYLVIISLRDSSPAILAICSSIPTGISHIFSIFEVGRNLRVASATIAAGFE